MVDKIQKVSKLFIIGYRFKNELYIYVHLFYTISVRKIYRKERFSFSTHTHTHTLISMELKHTMYI